MLHKIHRGEELANASTYTLVGFGGAAWPNNFGANTYAEVVFPALPGGTANCAKCHGDTNTAWIEPSDRNHPTVETLPVRSWRAVCGACHDSDAATAHIEAQTAGGAESCTVCHGPGRDWSVQVMHKTY
jgi:OmcA/MtrC family decaheme c-type cytochrome